MLTHSVFDESKCFGVVLLLALLNTLVSLLLGTKSLHHVDKITSHHISLLLFSSQGSLGTLQPLFLVLLHAGGLFWIFSDSAIVSVPEEHTLLFRWHIGGLLHHLSLFLD